MSEHLHPGPHLDADSLSAFVEGMLPEHERQQCLAHLSECDHCREAAFLAHEPQPEARIRRPWLSPVPIWSGVAAACLIVVSIWWFLNSRITPRTGEVASVTKTQPIPVAPPAPPVEVKALPPSPAPRRTSVKRRTTSDEGWTANIRLTPRVPEQPTLPPPPSISFEIPGETARGLLPPPNTVQPPAQGRLSGITGTVSDPSGAVIPRATVTLHAMAGTSSSNTETDASGKFKVTGLPAGRYELQIEAPGFQRTVVRLDLTPEEVAVLTPTLSIGSMAQTVEVDAAATTVQTESAMLSIEPKPLPSKLPADATISNGKLMLSLDTDGALFLSRNKGKSWKAVKPVWRGKVVDLAKPDVPSKAKFQLTTESGADWLSQDGSHWYAAPAQH